MDGSPQAVDPTNAQTLVADEGQRFLLFFIMGTYFGPDLKGENPQKSVLQRISEGLPSYTSDQLAGSYMKTIEVEQIYHYVLRKADKSTVVKLPLLRQFFDGNLPKNGGDPTANYPQFPDLFPPLLHPISRYRNRNIIVENIVFINNPEIYYIDREDIKKFRRLTGLEDFLLDEDAARLYDTTESAVSHSPSVQGNESNEELFPFKSSQKYRKTRRIDELLEMDDPLQHEGVGPATVFLPSPPTKSELSNIVAATKSGFALTGSAAMGRVGPTVGLIDIGECEDSYLFRISLPGVKRDESELPFSLIQYGFFFFFEFFGTYSYWLN